MSRRTQTPLAERMARLTADLYEGRSVTAAHIMRRYGATRATAKRDMVTLEAVLPVSVGLSLEPGDRPRRKHLKLMPN